MIEREDTGPRADDARPVMGFRVGITGHRTLDPMLVARLEQAVSGVLADVEQLLRAFANSDAARELYADSPPVLRMISPLAEGADRLVARLAVGRGWRLAVPLPFPRDEYERDFPGSVPEFRSQLADAEKTGQVLELDGKRERASEAYLQVGRFVLDHSDLLIAIWDGKKAAGQGGTGEIVGEALDRGIPVIHIASAAPHLIELHGGADEAAPYDRATLDAHIRCLILPRWAASHRNHGEAAAMYLQRERVDNTGEASDFLYRGPFAARPSPLAPLAWLFPAFIRLLGGKVKSTLPVGSAPPPAGADNAIVRSLYLHFQRADTLATYYSKLHRSSFLLIYFFGALSLIAALTAQFMHASRREIPTLGTVAMTAELISLVMISALFLADHGYRWRERWLDYRLLSEMLREMDLLAQIGGTPLIGSLDRLNDLHPVRGWVAWFVAAVVRSHGIVGGRYTEDYLKSVRDYAAMTRLADQIGYHERNEKGNAGASRWLRRLSQLSFGLTAIVVIVEIVDRIWALPIGIAWPPFLAGLFPAVAAASFGVRNQAEFEIVVHRSGRLREQLSWERDRIANIDAKNLTSASLARAVRRAARVMQRDTLEWAAIFEVKESEVA